MISVLPLLVSGKVVKGFGRGGKDLGCPTANLDDEVLENLPKSLICGVYYGLARVGNGEVYKTALSIGLNPHYGNERKTLEVHLIDFHVADFYGSEIRVLIVGFIREMTAFISLDHLKAAIANDIAVSKEELPAELVDKFKIEYFSE
ncbi:unnamed protein product [Caenorhabditis auriculariae]|uniref:riboflavin kinase n=1 Tax=Caenorhabditis auriculariae TaxID=2777116 RepID=A0A8S1HP11_9PELO|nr:unnamed protein product [Caenorhabditis auriculariae]